MILFKNCKIHIIKSWWIILFALLCYVAYEQGGRARQKQLIDLAEQLAFLQSEKTKALEIQNDLFMQVNSQSDPAWVELTLMKGLGLVPEGHIKVLFIE